MNENGEKRFVPLSPEADLILSASLAVSMARFGEWNWIPSHKPFSGVFLASREDYEKEWEEKKVKADPSYLVDLTFHDFRYEATSRIFEKGLNPM